MLQKALDSLLPGLRDVRGPLVSGALWSLLIWVWFLGDQVPTRAPTSGLWHDAATLIDFLGRGGTIAVGGVAIFLVGVLAAPFSDLVGLVVGNATRRVQRRVAWEQRARESVRREQRRLNDKSGNEAKTVDARKRLEVLSRKRLGLIVRDADSTKLVGESGRRHDRRADALSSDAFNAGMAAEWQRLELRGSFHEGAMPGGGWDLLDELSDHPLDALQVLDEVAFLAADRTKAEREFRLAVAIPIVPLGGTLCASHAAGGTALVAAALAVICREAARSDDLDRVLGFLGYTGKRTPSLRAAERAGMREAHEVAVELSKAEKPQLPGPIT